MNIKHKYQNVNPKLRVELDAERLEVLRRIKNKMSDPVFEITAAMIAYEMDFTPDYIRQAINRRTYVSLERYLEIERVIDKLWKEFNKTAKAGVHN